MPAEPASEPVPSAPVPGQSASSNSTGNASVNNAAASAASNATAASACAAHRACADLRLDGSCCPAADGTYLGCCDVSMPKPDSKVAMLALPIPAWCAELALETRESSVPWPGSAVFLRFLKFATVVRVPLKLSRRAQPLDPAAVPALARQLVARARLHLEAAWL